MDDRASRFPVVLKYQSYPQPLEPTLHLLPRVPSSHPSRYLGRAGIKSATHQPLGYLKSLSVDRPRYRRCFVRETRCVRCAPTRSFSRRRRVSLRAAPRKKKEKKEKFIRPRGIRFLFLDISHETTMLQLSTFS